MKTDPVQTPSPATILLVDDMDACRLVMKWFLTNFGYSVVSASSAEEAYHIFDPTIHDLVLTDNSMPGMTGADLASAVKSKSPSTRILMYTGRPPTDRSNLDLVIQKPAHLLQVKAAVDRLLHSGD